MLKLIGSSHVCIHTSTVTGGVVGGVVSETVCDGVDDPGVLLSPGPGLSPVVWVCPPFSQVSPETRPLEPPIPNPALHRLSNHWTGSGKSAMRRVIIPCVGN